MPKDVRFELNDSEIKTIDRAAKTLGIKRAVFCKMMAVKGANP